MFASKWGTYACLILAVLFQTTFANPSKGQTALSDYRLTLDGEDLNVDEVFRQIEHKTPFVFSYNPYILTVVKPISFPKKEQSLADILTIVAKEAQLEFRRVNYNISVKKSADMKSMLPLEDRDIKGVVTDQQSGEPLIGATVKIEGTNLGSVTELDGSFAFSVPANTVAIVVTYSGYERKIVTLGDITYFEIALTPSMEALEEVVVIGYGTQKKANLTSSISKVDALEVDKVGFSGTDQLLQGRVAGVQLISASGNPGGQQRINIRGVSSLTGENRPLIVLDGVPLLTDDPSLTSLNKFGEANETSPLSLINPNDVASIEVLKDASASAIYGSRATNGVIIITTRKGNKERTNISVNAYTGIQSMPATIHTTGTEDYLKIRNEANANFNADYGLTPSDAGYLDPILDPRTADQEDTDWMSLITRDFAKISDFSLSAAGGTDKTDVYSSLGYFDQEGIIHTSRFRRFTTTFNVGQQISHSFSVRNNLSASYAVNNRVVSHGGINLLQGAIRQRPYDTPYDENGNYNEAGSGALVTNNGVQGINESDSDYRSYRIVENFSLDYQLPIKGLSYKTLLGLDFGVYHDQVFWTREFLYAQNDEGQFTDSRNIALRRLINNQLTYKGSQGRLNYTLTAVHAWEHFKINRSYLEGIGFPFDASGSLGTATSVRRTSFRLNDPTDGNNIGENAIESYIGRALIDFSGKYLLTFALRADGSSQFADGKKYGTFPSASVGWRVSDESFFTLKRVINNMKIRASWGKTGNVSGIDDFASLAIATSGYTYAEQEGATVVQVANDQLTWENTTQTDLGIDLGLLKNKLQIHLDYFDKYTTDLLIYKPVPSTSGFTTLIQNLGAIRNRGVELELFYTPVHQKDFRWDLDFNVSQLKNRVERLPDGEDINPNFANIIREGESLPSFFLLKQTGIYQTNEEVPANLYEDGVRAGDVMYEDVNEDGLIDDSDRQVVGNAFPELYGGMTNTLSYKNVDFSVFANFSFGNELFLNPRDGASSLNGTSNFSVDVVNNRWTGAGTSNSVPRAIAFNTWNDQNSTRFLESGSFVRIKTVTLGYNLPLNKLKYFTKLRVYASAMNLFTFTNYTGFNPEASDFLETETFGLDEFNSPPALRTFTLGINANF